MNNLNNLLMNGCNLFDALFYLIYCNRFFTNYLHFSYFLGNVRNDLLYLFNFLLNNWFLLYLSYFFDCSYFFNHLNQFFYMYLNLNNFLYLFLDNYKLLNNFIAGNRHLERNNNSSLNFDNFLNLKCLRH